MLVDVGAGGNLEREPACGNYSRAREHEAEAWEKAVRDVKTGMAVAMPMRLARMVRGLRINPVGVVEEKGKRRVVHDSTYSAEPEARGGGGGSENETPYWNQIPEFYLVDVRPNYQEGTGAEGQSREGKECPDTEDGREEYLSAGRSGPGGGSDFG